MDFLISPWCTAVAITATSPKPTWLPWSANHACQWHKYLKIVHFWWCCFFHVCKTKTNVWSRNILIKMAVEVVRSVVELDHLYAKPQEDVLDLNRDVNLSEAIDSLVRKTCRKHTIFVNERLVKQPNWNRLISAVI